MGGRIAFGAHLYADVVDRLRDLEPLFDPGHAHLLGLVCPAADYLLLRCGFKHLVRNGDHLLGRDVAADAKRHVAQIVKRVVAAIQYLRRYLRDGFDRAGDIHADRMVDVQRAQQVEIYPPAGVVDIHLYLFADYALFLGDGFFGEIRRGNKRKQHAQVVVKVLGAGEEVYGG